MVRDAAIEASPGIFQLPLLSAEECDLLVEAADSSGWKAAEIINSRTDGGHVQSDFRLSDASFFYEGSEPYELLNSRIRERVIPLVADRWGVTYDEHSEVHVVRYRKGQYFKAHTDSGDYGDRTARRYFTVVCYLNDDLEGGGTSFPDVSYTVAPKKGHAVIFPADFLHQGDEILDGTKYIAVAWLVAPPPTAWI